MTSIDHFLERWSGEALRHISTRADIDVLDFSWAGRYQDNRWNTLGERTLYLAGDSGVMVAEWARHFVAGERPRTAFGEVVERRVFGLEISLEHVLDLRKPDVLNALAVEGAPFSFLDFETSRATAQHIRKTSNAQAILVPSMAFLEQLNRWCLVVFLEKLPDDPKSFISAVNPLGPLRLG